MAGNCDDVSTGRAGFRNSCDRREAPWDMCRNPYEEAFGGCDTFQTFCVSAWEYKKVHFSLASFSMYIKSVASSSEKKR